MKRRNRELSIFNLSALDVLAMATGTFVVIMVMLMPYYRKSFDAHAAIEDIHAATDQVEAQSEQLRRAAQAKARALESLQAEAERIERAAASQQAAAASLRQEAALASGRAADHERKLAELQAEVDRKVIKELDLVFVIDTTASMTQAIENLSLSMAGIIKVLERLVPSLRVGVVAYRDHDLPSGLLRVLPPTPTATRAVEVQAFVDSLQASPVGGRTPQEALYEGLRQALDLPLRSSAKQAVIVIGDAAAHDEVQASTLMLARRYAGGGGRHSISTLFVPTESYRRFGRGDRGFFQSLASAGGGSFTDHSGQLMEAVLLSALEN